MAACACDESDAYGERDPDDDWDDVYFHVVLVPSAAATVKPAPEWARRDGG